MNHQDNARKHAFRRRLAEAKPLLLDGGLATELEAMNQPLHPELWSAGLLHTAPDAIRAAHRAYVDAGAEVLISASYQASHEGFIALGLDREMADELLRRSVRLAREAAIEAGKPETLIAASVGPWGATRNDGSEYTGVYTINGAALRAFHAERLAILDQAGADILACETLPSKREAAVLAPLLQEAHTDSWVSFCCRDAAHLSDGTPIEEAAALFTGRTRVRALAINCTAPRHVPELLERLHGVAPDLPLMVYPNSGECYDADRKCWRGAIEPLSAGSEALAWVEAGAQGIGGCCRVGPSHIQSMAQALNAESPS
ncbi:MAG: homocysteine S-methyltransferase [Pseudomonadota bacterium]